MGCCIWEIKAHINRTYWANKRLASFITNDNSIHVHVSFLSFWGLFRCIFGDSNVNMLLSPGLAVSQRHTYMFSAGDDKQVKCWDLEYNKVSFIFLSCFMSCSLSSTRKLAADLSWFIFQVIRSYHGHLSGVYCLALHPTIDILFTGGRDSVCRVWIFFFFDEQRCQN